MNDYIIRIDGEITATITGKHAARAYCDELRTQNPGSVVTMVRVNWVTRSR